MERADVRDAQNRLEVTNRLILRTSSAIVPDSMFDTYLSHVQATTIPAYEAATGLISVSVFRRPVVGYVELLTLTMWQSGQALTGFLDSCPPITELSSDNGVIHMESHVYELVASGQGTSQTAESSQAG